MATPKKKELGGARNMRTSTKVIIGIFAVIMALSMMLPSLAPIFAQRSSSADSTQEESNSQSSSEASEKTEEGKKEGDAKEEGKDEEADPKVPDNESLKSLEKTNKEKVDKLKKRLEEDPNNLAALLNLGEAYMNWGYSANSSSTKDEEKEYSKALLNKAMSYYDRYLKLNDSVTVKINRALTQYYAGETDQAIAALKKICEENPQNALAQAQLGYLYESQYDTKNATAAYTKAAELDSDDTYGIKTYANQRLIALNSKVSSVGDPGDAGIKAKDPDEGQSELLKKLSQSSDATI